MRTHVFSCSLLALAASSLLMVPSPASATTTAVVLPSVGGDETVPEPSRQQALQATADVFRNRGWILFNTEEVEDRLPTELRACSPDAHCAGRLRSFLGLDAAVGVRVFGSSDRVERVSLVVFGPWGTGQRADADVDPEAGIPFAIADAAQTVLRAVGTGRSAVQGHTDRRYSLAAAEGSWQEAHPLNFVLGGLFAAASVPFLIYSIQTLARNGECIQSAPFGDFCVERVEFAEGSAILGAAGVLALTAGLVFLIAQPIQIRVHATDRSAGLHVTGRF